MDFVVNQKHVNKNIDVSEADWRPTPGEWIGVFLLLAAVFLLNVLTHALYPAVWNDDILWSEPAINLVRTGHFTTSVWQLEPANSFWAAQSPAYPLLLSLWLRLAGFSLLAVRSFNFLLVSCGAFLLWRGAWKYQLVQRPGIRLMMVALVLFGYGLSFAYRSSRPDMLGMISLLSLGLAFGIKNTRWRIATIFLCAAATAWVGVQIGLYACCAVFLAKLLFRKVSWRDVFLVGAAVGVGAASLLLFYHLNGVLGYFMASLNQAANEHQTWGGHNSYLSSLARRLSFSVFSYIQDFSSVPLIAGGIILFATMRRFGPNTRLICYFLGLFIWIPVVFNFTGHFAFYYSYMLYVPMVLAFSLAASWALDTGVPKFIGRGVLPACMAGAILVGLPLRLVLCSIFCRLTPRDVYRQTIAAQVRPQDIVFCEYNAFFEAKQCVQEVFIPAYSVDFVRISPRGHTFTAEEKKQINVMIIRPETFVDMKQYFGGEWKPVSQPFGDRMDFEKLGAIPIVGRRLQHHFDTPQMSRHMFQIFRREESAVVAVEETLLAARKE